VIFRKIDHKLKVVTDVVLLWMPLTNGYDAI